MTSLTSYIYQFIFKRWSKFSLPIMLRFFLFMLFILQVLPNLAIAQVKIMPLGNSITQANHNHNSYRRALWQQLRNNGYTVDFVGSLKTNYNGTAPNPDFDLDHEGHWGWRADQLQVYTKQWAMAAKPDIILMHAGTNDMIQKQSIASTINDISRMIDDFRAANPRIIILLAQLIGSDTRPLIATLNQEIPKLAAQKTTSQSPIIVVNQANGFNSQTDTYDGIHPNSVGEQKMANHWFTALKTVLSSPLRSPENPAQTLAGLNYQYYQGNWNALPNFNLLTPVKSGYVNNFDLSARNRDDNFGFSYSGYISIPTDGQYTFYTSSDDGSKLFIGTTQVVNNDGLHGKVERSGKIGLKAGKHAFKVDFFENTQGQILEVRYQGPTVTKQLIPASVLFRIAPTNSFNGEYRLIAKHSNKALQITNGSTTDGAYVQQWTINGTTAQQWRLEALANGYYKISCKVSGKAMAVQNAAVSNGGRIQQQTYTGADHQQWKIETLGNGYYKIISKLSGKLIDVSGGSIADGANVHQWTSTGGTNQYWKLEKLSAARIALQTTQQTEISMYPNPTSNILTINYTAQQTEEAEIIITDLHSRTQLNRKVNLTVGANVIDLDINFLKQGSYIVSLISKNRSITRKINVTD